MSTKKRAKYYLSILKSMQNDIDNKLKDAPGNPQLEKEHEKIEVQIWTLQLILN